ncbi:MAG: L,D-transpeptidase [Myxococcota bacterium]
MKRWLVFLVMVGCGGDDMVVAGNDAALPPVVEPAPAPEPAPSADPLPEPTPPPTPAPDPEAEALARAEAAQRAFDAQYPNHGLTFHFLARVRGRPHHRADVVGYMRRGARFRASSRVPGVGCARGWFEVPGDGFVCRGEGFLIDDEPPSFEPTPVPAALEDALPYAYGFTARADVPQYWRVPTPAEETRVVEALSALAAEEAAAAEAEAATEAEATAAEESTAVEESAAAEESAAIAESAATAPAEALPEEAAEEAAVATEVDAPTPAEVPEVDGTEAAVAVAAPTTNVEAPPPPGTQTTESEPAEDAVDPSLVAAAQGTIEVPDYVRLRMGRGFYVSLDGEVTDEGRRFFRTVRGAYVRANTITGNEPPTHRGVVLGGRWQLPVAFVFRSGTHRLRRLPSSGRLRDLGVVERHTPFPIADRFTRARREYLVARDGYLVRRTSLRVASAIERPTEIPESDRWVHVNLKEQTLVAYEGDHAVFATTVSTGREGFDTPVGIFRIASKHVSTTMDDLNAGEESYLIEDVPWTMYFQGNFALHAAFWHHGFGRVRSHGCVNLAPADARWVFQWAGPVVPAGWHGIFAGDDRPGSWIVITEE